MDQIYESLEKLASGMRLSSADKAALPRSFERMHELLEARGNPPGFRLASGEVAKGATGRIALNAYLLLLARAAYGRDYGRQDKRLRYWELYLGFHIMRSHFGGWSKVRGIYCCATCTLSVLPLYCRNVFGAFDCAQLKTNVLEALDHGAPPFTTKYSRRYEAWARRFV